MPGLMVGFEHGLRLLPQVVINNGRVIPGIHVLTMHNFAAIHAVMEQMIEMATRKRSPAARPPASTAIHFGHDPRLSQLFHKR